jgi:DNA-binding transcriptional MerR regulator
MTTRLKIGEISRQTRVPASTIRYYVSQGLLPKPDKVNRNMSYYDEICVEKIRSILYLKESRHYPLTVIKNILKRMDQGLSLENAEELENTVIASPSEESRALVNRKEFLENTGLTSAELKEAEKVRMIMPYRDERGGKRYDRDDIRFGRDVVRVFLDKAEGTDLKPGDFGSYVTLCNKVCDQEESMRRKLVKGKSTREKLDTTVEVIRLSHFFRTYIFKRLYQRRLKGDI